MVLFDDDISVGPGPCFGLEGIEDKHRLIQEHERDRLLLDLLNRLHHALGHAPVLLVAEVDGLLDLLDGLERMPYSL